MSPACFRNQILACFVIVAVLSACVPVPQPVEGPAESASGGDQVGLLLQQLSDGNAAARADAAYALGRLGADAAPHVPALLAATRDEDPTVRTVAAFALGKIGAPEAVTPRLLAMVSDKDERTGVRYSATRALGNLGTPGQDVTRVLSETLALDPDENLRWAAVAALTRMKAPPDLDLLPVLVNALQDSNWYVANQASELLAASGEEGAEFLVNDFKAQLEWGRRNAILHTLTKMPEVAAPRLGAIMAGKFAPSLQALSAGRA